MYLGLLALYLILVPLQVYAAIHQNHHITRLFTTSLGLQLTFVFCSVVHMVKFAIDGQGFEALNIVGDVMHLLAQVVLCIDYNYNFKQHGQNCKIIFTNIKNLIDWFMLNDPLL